MRRAVRGAVPGIAVAIKRFGTGVALRLRVFDFIRKRPRPFIPTEQPPRVQRDSHGEGLGFPGFTKDWPVGVARNTGNGTGCVVGGLGSHQARSRYGSQASIETFKLGSDACPHNSPPSNVT